MTANDELVVKLFALATYAEKANHWTDDKRLMDAAGVADVIHEGVDRIEELEAKLAKAVGFMEGAIRYAGNSGDDYLAEQARTTLAELTGGKDE